MHIIDFEQPEGVVVQFGGQTAINLADELAEGASPFSEHPLKIWTAPKTATSSNRRLEMLQVPQPLEKRRHLWKAPEIAANIGYPVLVRPSYVLGGRAMEIVYHEAELLHYMENAVKINPQHPVLIDKYLTGKEIEVDAISDGETVVIPGIMEHIERAGVHSGIRLPFTRRNLSEDIKKKLEAYTIKLAKGLNIVGLLNIQFVLSKDEVFVLEVNPSSSRTVPFLKQNHRHSDGQSRNKGNSRTGSLPDMGYNRRPPKRAGRRICESAGLLVCEA